MTVFFSKKCEYGLQAILFMAARDFNCVCPAEEISKKLNIPKEFISKILQSLTESGIVESKKGKLGGFKLAMHPSKIKLIDIVEAIDGLESFNSCVLGFPECTPDKPCPVHDQWGELRAKALEMLSAETIDMFKEKTLNKIGTI
ncbi:MAG: Rrf2 family transcriptional regulator [Ignavibacteriaceae bacterium]|nr:Rrf2 family transcriptional regulator [Ignavibacterium sp.]MCC6254101.1 Rrf2 family transcriptional regulator [Ignavibacteriaceae bacterium]HRN26264.1 Rrf2 family transcriptional regulator [Ignavibacteriaceae bacterium]HRP91899.1 Rrf2 family transcriptional regulator [Ignavibacteriaceae bacterium]HRQ53848.1 Rrf2 family transcriptional regulator [Ignavibacteriaceae bacterium]